MTQDSQSGHAHRLAQTVSFQDGICCHIPPSIDASKLDDGSETFTVTPTVVARAIKSEESPNLRTLHPADAQALMLSHARRFAREGDLDKAHMALIVAARADRGETKLPLETVRAEF